MTIALDGQIFLVEVTAAIDSLGTTQTFYFCGGAGGFTTAPTDTPANQYYEPRLLQPADFTRPMFSDVTTAGQSTVTWGTLDLENIDGGLDSLMNYSFDNRLIRILVGDPLSAYSTFNVVMQCTVALAQFSYKMLSFTLRDLQAALDLQLITHLYGGTNILPAGVDGTSDIAGTPVPRLYGSVLNIQPVCVNTSALVYQIHDGAINGISNVYDSGVALTVGVAYGSLAALLAASTTSGQYDTYLGGGYFKLGATPAGQLTCDCYRGAAVANRTPAQLVNLIVKDMGFTNGQINQTDLTSLDLIASYDCGVWVNDTSTALTIIDKIIASCGAYVGFDNLSMFRIAQLQSPSGVAVISLDTTNIKDIDLVATNDAQNGIPICGVNVTYAVNNNVQTSGLAGSVSAARRTILALPYLTTSVTNSSVKNQYLSSQVMQRDTVLISSADAISEGNRLQALYGVQRYPFQATVKLDTLTINNLNLNSVVLVTIPRFNLNAGKLLRLIQIEADYANTTAILTLWG